MKKYIKLASVAIFSLLVSSCSEEKVLNLSPINNISNEDAYSSPSLIALSVNGMYNAAQLGQFNTTSSNGGRGYVWGAAFVQQGDNRGEDVVNLQAFYQITYQSTYDPNSANNVYYWIDGYKLINRCNLVIEGVSKAVANNIISSAVGNDYIGQAKFLRAITHFELLAYFAQPYNFTATASHPGIVYREVGIDTQGEIDSEILKGRNTVADCYSKVIADLNDAENLITQTADKSLATKNAAIAFKTRVYLHQRKWDDVITEGAKTLAVNLLTATPNGPFVTSANLTNSESVFSIRHAPGTGQNPGVNAALASQYKTRRLVCISPIIWNDPSWLADDKRREEGVMVETVSGVKYTNKYKDGGTYTDAAPVIRYAEVVLNMAEAQARKSSPDLTAAISLLNSVRNRSLASPSTQAYTAATLVTQADVVNAILKERRIEFLMEGRRWSDIHRLLYDDIAATNGIPAKVGNGTNTAALYSTTTPYSGPYGEAAIPKTNFRILWPIPLQEINTNPTLASQQNPGW
ncbi:RagB/SusD family nutrient uptake outer membrane protein [Flavobacterium sp.]|jgi:hypothetical protein|uniref:RagB/SusD family nutrient uptake outer membrane protein n=1 Tax=Flavobacterium sp. TaxID=239 RepID=UPI0037C0F290